MRYDFVHCKREHSANIHRREHDEDLPLQIILDIERRPRHDKVYASHQQLEQNVEGTIRTEEPLRSACDRQSIMPRRSWENVADVYPRQRAPPHAVEAYVDVQHRRHRLARRRWREADGHRRRWRVRLQDRGDDEE